MKAHKRTLTAGLWQALARRQCYFWSAHAPVGLPSLLLINDVIRKQPTDRSMTPVICQSQWMRNCPEIFCISNKGATSTVLGLFLKNGWSGYLKEGIIREAWGYYTMLLLMCGCLWVWGMSFVGSSRGIRAVGNPVGWSRTSTAPLW